MERVGDYEIYKDSLLGKGAFSQVYLSKYVGDGTRYIGQDKRVAIKIIDTSDLKEEAVKIIEDEIEIMDFIKENPHPNIVECYDTIRTDSKIYIVMEFCDSGNLRSIIKKPIREKWIQFYFSQLANGLKYLDHNCIMHRDLKPRNILLTNRRKFLKIADFGFARRSRNESLYDTMCGSPLYMAPEIMRKDYYNKQTDLWSIGMILFEMLYGFHPYHSCKKFEQLQDKINETEVKIPPDNCRNKDVSEDCLTLLKSLLQKDYRNRITWDDFFENPWINLYATEVKKTEKYKEQINSMSLGSLTPQGEYLRQEEDYEDTQSRLDIIDDYYDKVTHSDSRSLVKGKESTGGDTDFLFDMELDEARSNKSNEKQYTGI